ncbi:DUF6397 family protein [Streptomyces sp. NPDC059783]|uniref:DUF6397 family protein n=1 Tax=Streptomyces sp. NPDC059783 TaxID=3346944 RepID=UPI003667315C
MSMTDAVRDGGVPTLAASRAATELELRRGEFDLAVHLGLVQPDARGPGRLRFRRTEIERLREQPGFPEALREQVHTVGTAEGARLLGITPVRFARLARAGCVTPIAFYLNRYRAVVWLYLARELHALAERSPELLTGVSPAWIRHRVEEGDDFRARNWRSRRIERLLALTEEPWARAAVVAQALDPLQLAEVVDDPYERAHLARSRPESALGHPGSPAGRDAFARLMLADDPDEILWRRIALLMELDHARERCPAPRPGDAAGPGGREGSPARDAEPRPPGAGAPSPPPGAVGEAEPSCAPEPRATEPGPSGARRRGAGRGRSGILARLWPRASRPGRRPRGSGPGRTKEFASGARTRHSDRHVDQGSNF